MRAEKLGIPLQRFRKYSSSFPPETVGFHAENRWRFRPFSAGERGWIAEGRFVHRISADLSAEAAERGCALARPVCSEVSTLPELLHERFNDARKLRVILDLLVDLFDRVHHGGVVLVVEDAAD